MKTIYRLADDANKVGLIQKATLTTADYGIRQTHGLFGSPEWWRKIESGELVRHTISGRISSVYMAGMRDWPEFRVRLADGSEESFTREANSIELAKEYEEGKKVEVDFVWQQHKKAFLGTPETRIILEIRTE